MMKLFVYPGYSLGVFSYPNVVCSGCQRNLYLLRAGKSVRGSWGEKIAKIFK